MDEELSRSSAIDSAWQEALGGINRPIEQSQIYALAMISVEIRELRKQLHDDIKEISRQIGYLRND